MQYLYLIKCQQFYKIGIANDVQSRLAQLSTGNPFELEVLAVYGYDNAEIVERALHQAFANNRKRGEWFELDIPELNNFRKICQLLGGVWAYEKELATVGEGELAEAEQEQELLGGINWRLERRDDRNPPGFAIMERGHSKNRKCLGYLSGTTLHNPSSPTIQEVESFLQMKYGAAIVGNVPVAESEKE